jgi:hypothetical protein
MLNRFATLPKPASEMKDGSNAPVSGDAVHDYVESKIPSSVTIVDSVASGNPNAVSSGAVYNAIQAIPKPPNVVYNSAGMTYTSTWTGASNALILGDVITLSIQITKQSTDVSLNSGDVQIGTLGSGVPRPMRITLFTLIPNPLYASDWFDGVNLTGYIFPNDILNNKNGEVFICRHPGITISGSQRRFVGSATWIQRTIS